MIDLYAWSTPNCFKISIMLEECGLPYRIHCVDITTNVEQFAPQYLKINPNGKVPSIIDSDGPNGKSIAMMESGAILIYLAEKTGRFLDQRERYSILQWLMFQMGGVGPSFGQAHHFMRAKKDEIPYGTERYGEESRRLYGVMDQRLRESRYFADLFSIADMAIYPWVWRHTWHRVDLAEFPNVKRWYDEVGTRPAVTRGMVALEPERLRAVATQQAAVAGS